MDTSERRDVKIEATLAAYSQNGLNVPQKHECLDIHAQHINSASKLTSVFPNFNLFYKGYHSESRNSSTSRSCSWSSIHEKMDREPSLTVVDQYVKICE